MMERITGYRCGEELRLSPSIEGQWVPVLIELDGTVQVRASGVGVLMLYHDHHPYGQPLSAALRMGWCRLTEDADPL